MRGIVEAKSVSGEIRIDELRVEGDCAFGTTCLRLMSSDEEIARLVTTESGVLYAFVILSLKAETKTSSGP